MTGISRRHATAALLFTAAGVAAPLLHAQEAWPVKPVRIIVPTPPGGNLDVVARMVAERLTAASGQAVIVENKTGASSSIGTRFVAQSAPDGATLLIVANTFASTPFIMQRAGYDPVKDFAGAAYVSRLPEILVVPASSPYKTLGALVAAAKAKPDGITYASAGAGSVARFATERLAHQLGLKLVHVPFKGNGEALIDMVAGRVDMMFDQMSTSLPHVRAGALRVLAVTSGQRSELLPDVPTVAEAGVRDFEDYTWVGLVVPAATPRDAVNHINTAVRQVLQQPELRARFAAQGQELRGNESPEEFSAFIRSEVGRLAKLAQDANIRLD